LQAIDRNERTAHLMTRALERLIQAQLKLDRTVDELRDQIAANTQALLRLIDRLDPETGR
jgi:hypothetical protein